MKTKLQQRADKLLADAIQSDTGCKLAAEKPTGNGYVGISLFGLKIPAHRLVYEAIHGVIPKGLQVMHSCDVRNCINPEHLSLGTNSDNQQDMHRKGRRPGRTLNYNRDRKLEETWDLFSSGHSQPRIAQILGINQSTVSRRLADYQKLYPNQTQGALK